MFILLKAYKERYQRPIEVDLYEFSDSKNLLVKKLEKIVEVECSNLNNNKVLELIKDNEEYLDINDKSYYLEYDEEGNLIYFSDGCDTIEYDGFTYQIMEIKEKE